MARVVMDVFWCDVVPLELWLFVWLVEAGSGGGLLVPRTAHCPAVSKQLQPKQYSEAITEDRQVLHIIKLSEAPRFRH